MYSSFATSVKNGLCSNLVCNTMDDYKNQIENAKKYLVEKYGIYVDFENSIVNSIEINRTFQINNSIADYKRPIELIAWNIQGKRRMNLVQDFKRKIENGFATETFVITSRKIKKNKYEKTKKIELEGKAVEDFEVARSAFYLDNVSTSAKGKGGEIEIEMHFKAGNAQKQYRALWMS